MARNKLIWLLLICIVLQAHVALPSGAQSPEDKTLVLPNTALALPEGCGVKVRWVSPPIDPKVVEGAPWYGLHLLVSPDGTPWIGHQDDTIISPVRQYRFELPQRYTSLVCMESGAFLAATEADICFIVPPKKLGTTYDKIPSAVYQPIANLPAPGSKLFAGVGNFVYVTAPRSDRGSDVYTLKMDQPGQGYVKIFTSDYEIRAVTGDAKSTFVAIDGLIVKVSADGAVTKAYANTREFVQSMAYLPGTGLFFSTNNGIHYLGAKGCTQLMAVPDSRIALREGSLYAFLSKSRSVLALDNIQDLRRFDRAIKEVPVSESKDIKVRNVRFFEAGKDVPEYQSRAYAARFDHRTTRFLYCQIDIDNLQYGKVNHKQTVTFDWYRSGIEGRLQSIDVSFNCRKEYSGMNGWARIGSEEPGVLYPGVYTVITRINEAVLNESTVVIAGEPDITQAASFNDIDAVSRLIKDGADVNMTTASGLTPLMLAVKTDNIDMVRILLDAGSDVNAVADNGETALMMKAAAWGDETPIIEMLLAAGADVKGQDNEGKTALHKAVRWDKVAVMRLLLQRGAKTDIKDKDGRTPLLAANLGFSIDHKATADTIEILLAHGADPDARDGSGNTALFNTIRSRNADAVAVLVRHGADVNVTGKVYGTTERSVLGYVLEQYQVHSRYRIDRTRLQEIASLLQAKGADLNTSEFERAFYPEVERILDRRHMIRMIEMSEMAATYCEPEDPLLRKAVIRGLLNAACREVSKATESYSYYGALVLCQRAADRARTWGMISSCPEIIYNMGLINVSMGDRSSARDYLEEYLDVAPTGSCAARARELLSEL